MFMHMLVVQLDILHFLQNWIEHLSVSKLKPNESNKGIDVRQDDTQCVRNLGRTYPRKGDPKTITCSIHCFTTITPPKPFPQIRNQPLHCNWLAFMPRSCPCHTERNSDDIPRRKTTNDCAKSLGLEPTAPFKGKPAVPVRTRSCQRFQCFGSNFELTFSTPALRCGFERLHSVENRLLVLLATHIMFVSNSFGKKSEMSTCILSGSQEQRHPAYRRPNSAQKDRQTCPPLGLS